MNGTPMLDAALALSYQGLPVFPLHNPGNGGGKSCSCGKPDCDHAGKHPRTKQGFKDATTVPTAIQNWWTTSLFANIGIATGEGSGLVVLDVDPRHGGDKTLASLESTHGALPDTVAAFTGGGGMHYYFKHPGGRVKSRSLGDGLDCKADGGYIVAPPSLHKSGRCYEWMPGRGICEITPADLPAWLLALMKNGPARGKLGRLGKAKKGEGPVQEGGRNEHLTSVAGKLRRAGLDTERIAIAIALENNVNCNPPLQNDEVNRIAASVGRYPTPSAIPYRFWEGGIEHDKPCRDGVLPVKITNFVARIVADVTEDDDAETIRTYECEAQVENGAVVAFSVRASEFGGLSWVPTELGARAIVFPGSSHDRHAVAAIQLLSRDTTRRTVYSHSGWRMINGAWFYLHAGGAIGGTGLSTEVQVSLTGPLQRFKLPTPPTGDALCRALRATLDVLKLGPDELVMPLIASISRAVLGGADFSVFIAGPTGVFKSELAALIQQHFGLEMNARHFPGSWSSTANALEEALFRGKDAVFVIDDFKPCGDAAADLHLNQKADRIFRGPGNGAGRDRMRPDTTLRQPRPPRAFVLSTGEEIPRGHSLRARMLLIEVGGGDIDVNVLTRCQSDARDGRFAATTAAYCQWLAADLDGYRQMFAAMSERARAYFPGGHARQVFMLADLMASFEIFFRFVAEATDEVVLSARASDALMERCRDALTIVGKAQSPHQVAAEPTARYLELLVAALSSGGAHVAGLDGEIPESPEVCGWRQTSIESVARPHGPRIGWLQGDDLYLIPTAAYIAAQKQAPPGEGISVTEHTLRRRLNDKRLLRSTESSRGSLLVRKQIGGSRMNVLHFSADRVLGAGVKKSVGVS